MNDISVKETTIACPNCPTLPTELLSLIIESFILIYSITRRSNLSFAESVRFTPQWYLLPLLRVSKLWHAITVKYLYQSIAVGSHAPFQHPVHGMRHYKHSWNIEKRTSAMQQKRTGHKVAEDLYKTLATNRSLAALITTLQLGIEVIYQQERQKPWSYRIPRPRVCVAPFIDVPYASLYWTETHIEILKLCPCIEHVDIRGYHHLKLDALIDELGKKTLVYLSISAHNLSHIKADSGLGKPTGRFSHILGLIQKWPKLRGIRAEGFLAENMAERSVVLDKLKVSGCSPDLQEIAITGAALHPDMYRALRTMCSSSITKLSVSLHGRQDGNRVDASADTLCECLRFWSPTLAYFKVDIMHHNDRDSYQPLNDAMRTLGELRELQFERMKLDLGTISGLPRLQCLAYLPHYRWSKEETRTLSDYLENKEKFPSLNFIVDVRLTVDDGFKEICRRRNIRLSSQKLDR